MQYKLYQQPLTNNQASSFANHPTQVHSNSQSQSFSNQKQTINVGQAGHSGNMSQLSQRRLSQQNARDQLNNQNKKQNQSLSDFSNNDLSQGRLQNTEVMQRLDKALRDQLEIINETTNGQNQAQAQNAQRLSKIQKELQNLNRQKSKTPFKMVIDNINQNVNQYQSKSVKNQKASDKSQKIIKQNNQLNEYGKIDPVKQLIQEEIQNQRVTNKNKSRVQNSVIQYDNELSHQSTSVYHVRNISQRENIQQFTSQASTKNLNVPSQQRQLNTDQSAKSSKFNRPLTSQSNIEQCRQNATDVKRSHTPNNLNTQKVLKNSQQANQSELSKYINSQTTNQVKTQIQLSRGMSTNQLNKSQSRKALPQNGSKTPKGLNRQSTLKFNTHSAKIVANAKNQKQQQVNSTRAPKLTDEQLIQLKLEEETMEKQRLEQQELERQAELARKAFERAKLKQLKKEFLLKTVTRLFQGYKVRRIMKNNRQINMLIQEHRDLSRFVQELKIELTDQIRQNNRQAQQTKGLLIQTIKDLTKKKEQFALAFDEVFLHSQWIKLSKNQPKQVQEDKKSNFSKSQQFDSFQSKRATQTQKLKIQETKSKLNESQNNLSLNLTYEKTPQNKINSSIQKKNSCFKSFECRDLPLRMQQNYENSQSIQKLNQSSTSISIQNQTLNPELQKYLSYTIKNQIQEEDDQRNISIDSLEQDYIKQKRNQSCEKQNKYLKKGVKSKKYDPKIAIKEQKEKKKQLEIEKEQETKRKQELEESNKKPAQQLSSFMNIQRHKPIEEKNTFLQDSAPQPQKLETEPAEIYEQFPQSESFNRLSRQFTSKIPRIKSVRENSMTQSTANLLLQSSIQQLPTESNENENHQRSQSRIPRLKESSAQKPNHQLNSHQKTPQNNAIPQLSQSKLELAAYGSEQVECTNKLRTARSRELRNSQSQYLQEIKNEQQRSRQLNQSCNFTNPNDQVQHLIEALQSTDLHQQAKEKTLETLTAITGMLQSLRNNKVLEKEKTILSENRRRDSVDSSNQQQQKLKSQFQNLVQNLQLEFNMLIDKNTKDNN
eukprot:403359402